MAYRPLVEQTATALKLKPTGEQLGMIEDAWLNAKEAGKLAPLPSTALDDMTLDGPKGSIVRPVVQLSTTMRKEMSLHPKITVHDEEILRLEKAMRVLEVPKYFDFESLSLCSGEQRHDLRLLSNLQLSPDQKVQVSTFASEFLKQQSDISGLERNFKNAVSAYQLKMTGHSDSRKQLDLKDAANAKATLKSLQNRNEVLTNAYLSVAMGSSSQQMLVQDLTKLAEGR